MAKKDATKEGGSTEIIEEVTETKDEVKETVDVKGTGHSDILEGLVKKREEEFERDSGIKLHEEETEDETQIEEKTDEDTENIEDKEDKTKDKPVKESIDRLPHISDDLEKIEIVVDGKKKLVTLSEVRDAGIRELQKESTAAKRLQEATELLKEAKKVKTAQLPDEEDTEDDEVEDTEELDSEDLKDAEKQLEEARTEHANAIQYGTDEEVNDALINYEKAQRRVWKLEQGAPKGATQTQISVDEVADKLEERTVLKRFHLSQEEGGFKDLTDDPVLRHACMLEVDRLLEDGEPNVWETYQKAGKIIRKKYVIGSQASDTDPDKEKEPTSKSLEAKKERKREIDTIPAATAKTESTVKKEKAQTPEEIVAEIKRARPGQNY